ncbi:MAG TPA: ATP-binding cassette domain-containing protein [Syntrophorhabdaceae bacterium]|jgi:phospholipid/cholesterol/gamma-HCH transport system ATP-binding protein|nr:ATP-binding cassette domain-containing protein [Syntrophorhabdaceae bacterium]HNT68205.1 ATP-binding cassette domain-containing protein [Syntrophorhabdaceae bacterium]
MEQDKFAAGTPEPHIIVRDLTMAYGDHVVQKDITFTVNRGDIFIIMGGSGCGKSTLLRLMIGLKEPARGEILYGDVNLWSLTPDEREQFMRNFGILYQSGALWSSMTLAENISLPLEQYTDLGSAQIDEIVSLKLSLVGLAGFEDYYPSELSGGMKKRAGLARAMAFDPDILFFDEPSAGLDPVSAKLLDDLILELRDSLGTTIVIVTHELASIFAIGNNSVFLDADTKTMIASGNPQKLLVECKNPTVHSFLTRSGPDGQRPDREPAPEHSAKQDITGKTGQGNN